MNSEEVYLEFGKKGEKPCQICGHLKQNQSTIVIL